MFAFCWRGTSVFLHRHLRFSILKVLQIISPFWTSSKWAHFRVEWCHSYPVHYKPTFAFSNLLYLYSCNVPYGSSSCFTRGTIKAYHVPPFEHVDLAACFRSRGFSDDEKFYPQASPSSISYGKKKKFLQSLSVVADDDLLYASSDIFGISTTSRSPGLRLPGRSLTYVLDLALACFAVLSDPLFIQDRRFIQSHG